MIFYLVINDTETIALQSFEENATTYDAQIGERLGSTVIQTEGQRIIQYTLTTKVATTENYQNILDSFEDYCTAGDITSVKIKNEDNDVIYTSNRYTRIERENLVRTDNESDNIIFSIDFEYKILDED